MQCLLPFLSHLLSKTRQAKPAGVTDWYCFCPLGVKLRLFFLFQTQILRCFLPFIKGFTLYWARFTTPDH